MPPFWLYRSELTQHYIWPSTTALFGQAGVNGQRESQAPGSGVGEKVSTKRQALRILSISSVRLKQRDDLTKEIAAEFRLLTGFGI